MKRPLAVLGMSLATAACSGAAWLAVEAHLADLDAERAHVAGRRPSAAALSRAAEERTHSAIEALADGEAAPAQRLAHYRQDLEAAEQLLAASLRVRPVEALRWVRLAALRWELQGSARSEGADALALMTEAAALAPQRADVHHALAELALDMGRTDSGFEHLQQAIALDERSCRTAIAALSQRGFAPAEIATIVPRAARHLVALAPVYFEEGQEQAYIESVEPVLVTELDVQLLATWAHAHRRLGAWSRLEQSLSRIDSGGSRAAEVQLRLERSRARLALGLAAGAREDAAAAFELDPANAVAAEQLGVAALAAGEPARALTGFRAALHQSALRAADARTRARLYRGIGQAEESGGRLDRAYEAYRRALELDPGEAVAHARLREIEVRARLGRP